MPGAEGRTGWPWNALPWQFNWGFVIIELAPYLILLSVIFFGAWANRLRIFRRRRATAVENFAGAVTESTGPIPYVVLGLWIVVAIAVIIYTINNSIFGEQY